MTVSMVKRVHQTETHPISFDEIWAVTKSGGHDLKARITQIRNRYEAERDITGDAEKARKAVAELKLELPGFLPSGTFSKRDNGSLVEYSGTLCTDADALGERLAEVRDFFKTCPFVHAVAVSPSGDGLKTFWNVVNDPARHEDSFRAIRNFVREWTGVEIDEKCKDLARICFFTYDPDLFIRDEGNQTIEPEAPKPRGSGTAGTPKSNSWDNKDMTRREQIAFRLLGELRRDHEKGGYFCRCPGESFHDNKTADKHTIVYLENVPTLFCQHQSCTAVVESFNKVLRSEIGKAEYQQEEKRSPLEPDPEPEERPWIEIVTEGTVSSTDLAALSLPPRNYLLGDWFCEGDQGFIYGPRGVGKTWLSLGVCSALSTGGKLGEWEAHGQIKVLYVDGEMPPDSMQARCRGLEANGNLLMLNHELLFWKTQKVINITRPEVQMGIGEFCIKNDIKVLDLDNLSTLASGMRENESDDWEKVSNWLLDLRRHKIAVIINHHAGRSGEMRGTSRREDAVFWILRLDDTRDRAKDKRGANFISRFTKASRNSQEEPKAFQWHFVTGEDGIISIGCHPARSLEVFRKIIEDGVTECSMIASEMGISPATVCRMAKTAKEEGWLEVTGRRYSIISTEEPPKNE